MGHEATNNKTSDAGKYANETAAITQQKNTSNDVTSAMRKQTPERIVRRRRRVRKREWVKVYETTSR